MGVAIVTVRGTDSEGAVGSYGIDVHVLNQPPKPVGSITDLTLEQGETVTIELGEYFRDPDGSDLAYRANVDPEDIAAVHIMDGEARVIGARGGTAGVTVTATDVDGASVTQDFTLTVTAVVRTKVLEETFDQGLDQVHWVLSRRGAYALDGGTLKIWSRDTNQGGFYVTVPQIKLWRLEARIRRVERTATAAVFGIYGEFLPYGYYIVMLRDGQVTLLINEYSQGPGTPATDSHTWSVEDTTAIGEYVDVALRYDAHEGLVVSMDDEDVLAVPHSGGLIPASIDDFVLLAVDITGGVATRIEADWVKVHGAVMEGSRVKGRVIQPVGIREHRFLSSQQRR